MSYLSNLNIDLAESFAACQSNEECFKVLAEQGERYGYKHFHFRHLHKAHDGKVEVEAYHSAMGPEYEGVLAKRQHLMEDPLVAHCMVNSRPKLWSELEEDYHSDRLNDRHREKIRHFWDFGVRSGVTVRLRNEPSGRGRFLAGVSLIPEFGTEPKIHDPNYAANLQGIMSLAGHFCAHVSTSDIAKRHFDLTDREYDVLQLLAEGCLVQQIADRLQLADRTAAHHLSNLRSKLGANSNAHAVAIAIRIHLI
ncbi:LuxR C-terminal-related transcriptional regulator [Pseudooceanicola sp. HF7]|uniref:helix-turn-helix transcriptional regulator n=1 Tax=Pseudooceanicola sp. HF7 TaxID=2721560 RepID=UPI0014307137|nr:LuxR C-terminal-related transcriptional regulator [Pseudooceanicola sp. HF7]NIZ11486.1 hypothetical protein [Pseudooceanicola sp. HF7]